MAKQESEAVRLAALKLIDDAMGARRQLEAANQGLLLEIADRKQSESALRESDAHFRAVMESANDAVITTDSDGIIEDWNPAAQRMFGYSKKEATGQPVTMLVPEQLRSRHLEAFERRRGGASSSPLNTRTEWEGRRKDGSEFPVELSLSEWSTPAGRHFTGVVHDITARKQTEAEKARLEAQYRQAQKMESIGRLAGGVAHDFNNMLAIISGYADLVMMKLDPAGPLYADLQEVTKAARRSAELVRQLLAFARKQAIKPRILDINETVRNMLKLVERLLGEDIDLVWKPGENLWPLKMDPTQIDQILANLSANARDAIAGTGKVTIESSNAVLDDVYCGTHPGSVPGRYVLLAMSDDGCGMDADTQAKVFEPFFTTKAQGRGTGLGLATVYGIVKQNLGFIDFSSEPGQGTTFHVYLPAYESAGAADAVPPVSIESVMGWETVLLVEDEATLLELGKRTLERLGYRVLATTSPSRAIELLRDYSGDIHLLLTDVVMPEMSGRTLQQRVDDLRPGLKCLFTSAYSADVIADRGVINGEVHFLQKPYTWQGLAEKVREVLGASEQ
ncbi:MAG: PAS domain S-box protein [Acidobacteria bacterium]|nr:PAS domain S-box protein [Acidobacteriota bacterium]